MKKYKVRYNCEIVKGFLLKKDLVLDVVSYPSQPWLCKPRDSGVVTFYLGGHLFDEDHDIFEEIQEEKPETIKEVVSGRYENFLKYLEYYPWMSGARCKNCKEEFTSDMPFKVLESHECFVEEKSAEEIIADTFYSPELNVDKIEANRIAGILIKALNSADWQIVKVGEPTESEIEELVKAIHGYAVSKKVGFVNIESMNYGYLNAWKYAAEYVLENYEKKGE